MARLSDQDFALPGARPVRLRFRTADCIPTLLAVVWLFAALTKVLDWSAFREVVVIHDVIPGVALPFLWVVPLAEGALGLGLLSSVGSQSRIPLLRRALMVATLVLMLFGVYIWLVPGATIEATGCGCFGAAAARVTAGIPLSARTTSLALVGVLIAAHALAFEWSAGPLSAGATCG